MFDNSNKRGLMDCAYCREPESFHGVEVKSRDHVWTPPSEKLRKYRIKSHIQDKTVGYLYLEELAEKLIAEGRSVSLWWGGRDGDESSLCWFDESNARHSVSFWGGRNDDEENVGYHTAAKDGRVILEEDIVLL